MPDGMPFPFLLAGEALATVSTVVHKVPNLFRYSLAFREQALFVQEYKNSRQSATDSCSDRCGERGIRTPGTVIPYGSLANCWFKPLTHLTSYPLSLASLHPAKPNRDDKGDSNLLFHQIILQYSPACRYPPGYSLYGSNPLHRDFRCGTLPPLPEGSASPLQ